MIGAEDEISRWLTATLLLSLRIGPVLAFAPPFTLVRLPAAFRVLLGLGVSGLIAGSLSPSIPSSGLAEAAARELLIGGIWTMGFQAVFGAIQLAGRTIDIQTGFGLAALVDPTTKAQTPLIGSLYAYAAGAIFFAMNGHLELVRVVAASLEIVPLGQGSGPADLTPLLAFLSAVFSTALGVGGGLILALLLTDVAIALMSRTAPQMNVLVLGFQVKTLLLMVMLPLTLGVSAALLARLSSIVLEALPALIV